MDGVLGRLFLSYLPNYLTSITKAKEITENSNNAAEFLETQIPADILSKVTTHTTTYWRFYSNLLRLNSYVLSTSYYIYNTFLYPFLLSLQSPSIGSILLLVVVLYGSLRILGILRRMVLWWTWFILRLVFWISVMIGALYIWQRGTDGVVNDFQWAGNEFRKEYRGHQMRQQFVNQAGVGARGRNGGARWY